MPEATTAKTIALNHIAHARSGDKGNHANIGVIAYSQAGYEFLREELTAERVADYFAGLHPSRVARYELPRLWALNFVLYDALAGGASQSLRLDTQGKLLSTAIEELELPEPERLEAMLRNSEVLIGFDIQNRHVDQPPSAGSATPTGVGDTAEGGCATWRFPELPILKVKTD